jgi:hypothetical protein
MPTPERHPRMTAMATFLVLTGLAGGVTGCGGGDKSAENEETAADQLLLDTGGPQPEYGFAPGLEKEYPELAVFLRRFMETCLAGDYAEYRRLVTRRADPETRARFEKVLSALKSVRVEEIVPLDSEHFPDPTYLVTSKVEFREEAGEVLRHRERDRVAILVCEEEGELRMAIAPSELQPVPEEDRQEEAAPTTTSAPSYDQWQLDGDY